VPVSGWQAGDPEHRAVVGPFDQYDVMGATQIALLFALGLRQTHRLLDIGCGSDAGLSGWPVPWGRLAGSLAPRGV
jgi:hypothetical protein